MVIEQFKLIQEHAEKICIECNQDNPKICGDCDCMKIKQICKKEVGEEDGNAKVISGYSQRKA